MSYGVDEMELERTEIDKVNISAKETMILAAATQLRIQYREDGKGIETLFSEIVPEGKGWFITIRIDGEETDIS